MWKNLFLELMQHSIYASIITWKSEKKHAV